MSHPSRKRMNISILIPFTILALVLGGLVWKKIQDSRELRPGSQTQEPATSRKGVLFFVVDGTRLGREARELGACGDAESCLQDLLDELVSGPVGDMEEALPETSEVNSVHVVGDLATVDMNKAFASEIPVGSSAEMLAVYSIVNTVCANTPTVTRVKLNVDGNDKAVLKHLDLSDPLAPDYTLEQLSPSSALPPRSNAPASETGKGKP